MKTSIPKKHPPEAVQQDEPVRTYRIGVAAQLSGVSEELIRAWERRFGVLTPRRTTGGYRVYSSAEIELLRRLKELVDGGMSIGEAAQLGPSLRREIEGSAGSPPVNIASPMRSWRTEILEGAKRIDQLRVEAAIDQLLSTLPPLRALEDVLLPLQVEIGQLWHDGKMSIASEHMVSNVVRSRLTNLLHSAPRLNGPHVLCACFPLEEHEIGLLTAALRFRHAGMRVTVLGARTPIDEVARAAREIKPDWIALSCVSDVGARAFERELVSLTTQVPARTGIVVGGTAAETHAEICARHGVTLLRAGGDWDRVLRRP